MGVQARPGDPESFTSLPIFARSACDISPMLLRLLRTRHVTARVPVTQAHTHGRTHTHAHTLTDWIAHVASPRINQQFVRCSVRFDHIFGLRYAGGHITFRSHNHNNNNNNKKPMYAFRHCVQVGERNTITLYARLHDDNTHTHSYAGGQNVRTFMRCHDPCELVCANSCTCVVVLG